jgi:hypothetical protein
VRIDNTDYISNGSVTIRRLARPIVELMLIEVIISASLKNPRVKSTRKE